MVAVIDQNGEQYMEIGTCDICKLEKPINRHYYHYDIKCDCHSPNHFEIVRYCSDCKPVEPNVTNITIKTSILKIYVDRINS